MRVLRPPARIALALGLVVAASCASDDDATPASSSSATAVCAWSVRADEATLNIAYPDTAATYWSISYALAPGEHLELSSRFPLARYASFVSYGPAGGAIDVVTDRDIEPDAGSTNPFRAASAPSSEGDNRYTITIERDAPAGAGNRLSATATGDGASASSSSSVPTDVRRTLLGSGGAEAVGGSVVYRVYLANDASDPTGGGGLPDVRLVDASGTATSIPTCENPGPSQAAIDIVNSFDRPLQDPPSTPVFIRPEQRTANLYPNPDNVYVATTVAHEPGRIVVVRGRAPTFPDTRHGASITGDEQVRFWSMCTNELRKPYPVTDCAADDETNLDADGFYTYVVSTPDDRPLDTAATADSTWLDWGATDVPGLLLMRHMLPNLAFAEAATRVDPGALASPAMKDYAPQGMYCDKAVFESGGHEACGL